MTGFAAGRLPDKADGSLIKRNGTVVGSSLAAQEFTAPQYFHERPSATSPAYNAAATTFANLGPTNPDLATNVNDGRAAILKLEGPYNPGLTIHDIPVDAVTTSGSGIDPDISPAYAQLQARRIAAVRHLPLATVQKLIDAAHRRPLPRLLRRARRERPRAQPRTRQRRRPEWPARRTASSRASSSLAAIARLVPEARPAAAAQEPGDVHRRARQRDHDR